MKPIYSLFLLIILNSCSIKSSKTTEFFIKNNCSSEIVIHSSALVRYSDGYKEESLTDNLQAGQKISMRKISVSENFQIKDVFTKIEIYKGSVKTNYDIMNKSNWTKTLTSDDKDEYTLTVENSLFN